MSGSRIYISVGVLVIEVSFCFSLLSVDLAVSDSISFILVL